MLNQLLPGLGERDQPRALVLRIGLAADIAGLFYGFEALQAQLLAGTEGIGQLRETQRAGGQQRQGRGKVHGQARVAPLQQALHGAALRVARDGRQVAHEIVAVALPDGRKLFSSQWHRSIPQ